MKKALVLALVGLATLFCVAVGLGTARSLGMSADALAGGAQLDRAPTPSRSAVDERDMRRVMKNFGGLNDLEEDSAQELGGGAAYATVTPPAPPAEVAEPPKGEAPPPEQPAARAWFPETFLFEPLVVTDSAGRASLPVRVPDRLTTWRVLALAHSRAGGQAGDVTSFIGTQAVYADIVAPAALYAGDEVRLPVQVVNTSERAVSGDLALSATGARLTPASAPVRVPAGGSVVVWATLAVDKPGPVALRAEVGDTDAVEKRLIAQPTGTPQQQRRGGTLAAPREFDLEGWANALPSTEAVQLRVFPGALGLVRAELAASRDRSGLAEDAYLLHLVGDAPALLEKLGGTPDVKVLRAQGILALQRALRHARAPSVDAATLLAPAAFAHPESPVLARLGERLAQQLAQAQRPDGTCQGGNGWTLQRLLVTTADCVRAVRAAPDTPEAKARTTRFTVLASGAFERNAGRIDDGYTAAAVLASGAVTGALAERLRAMVKAEVEATADGAKRLAVKKGVVRGDGRPPSPVEATALAILALGDDEAALLADLGSTLLAGYGGAAGWGDGRTNLTALRATVRLFSQPVPAGVTVTLARDGETLASGVMEASALTDVLTLQADATGSAGKHHWVVKAEPPVPGLGYSMTLSAHTPWAAPAPGGLELDTRLVGEATVGRPVTLAITASAPAGEPFAVTLQLPAGVQVDTPSVEVLAAAGRIGSFDSEDGRLTLHLHGQPAGAVFEAVVKLVPTLAGRLHAGPATITSEGRPREARTARPLTWVVR